MRRRLTTLAVAGAALALATAGCRDEAESRRLQQQVNEPAAGRAGGVGTNEAGILDGGAGGTLGDPAAQALPDTPDPSPDRPLSSPE